VNKGNTREREKSEFPSNRGGTQQNEKERDDGQEGERCGDHRMKRLNPRKERRNRETGEKVKTQAHGIDLKAKAQNG